MYYKSFYGFSPLSMTSQGNTHIGIGMIDGLGKINGNINPLVFYL